MGDVEPIIPPARHGSRERTIDVARDFGRHFLRAVDRLSMASAAQRPSAEEHGMGPISTSGAGTARWSASITRSMQRYASRRDGRRTESAVQKVKVLSKNASRTISHLKNAS